jgi:hypothetical protein
MVIRLLRIQTMFVLTLTLWAATCVAQEPAAPWVGPAASGANADSPPPGQTPSAGAPQSSDAAPRDFSSWPWEPAFWPSPGGPPSGQSSAGGGNGATAAGDAMMGDLGGRGMGGFGGDMHPRDSFRYGMTWFPTVGVHGQSADFEMFSEDLSFSHPLWADGTNAVSLSGGVRNQLIDSEAVLPQTGQEVPADLWNVNLGLRYSRLLDNGWITGGGVSIGSASDHPFWSIHEMNVGMNAMLRVPQNEHDAWLFTLMYSPTNELNFPIPGVAYSYNPSPQFHANIGLPFMLIWRPSAEWQFQASYMLLRSVHAKVQYRFTEWLCAVAAYDWSNEEYSLVDRPDLNDRFFIYDQRVSMSLQLVPMKHWTASLSAGYIFDRFLFEGTSFSPGNPDAVSLGAGPFAGLNLGARF